VNKEEIHMRHAFALILALVCTLSIVAAQTPAAPPAGQETQKPSTPSAPAAQSAASKVTYTGCLKPGSTADSWTLENAEVASAAGAKPGATATSGASKMTLGLNVKPSENIKPHANHKIEVTGTLSKAAGGASSATAPSQTINVESVKMVAATCP
jgi:hypothetical protein